MPHEPSNIQPLSQEEAELFILLTADFIGDNRDDHKFYGNDLERAIYAFETRGVKISGNRLKFIANLIKAGYIYIQQQGAFELCNLTLKAMDKLKASRVEASLLAERVRSMMREQENHEGSPLPASSAEAFAIWVLRNLSAREKVTRRILEDELAVYNSRGINLGMNAKTLVDTLLTKKLIAEVDEGARAHLSPTVGGVELLATNEQAVKELRTRLNE